MLRVGRIFCFHRVWALERADPVTRPALFVYLQSWPRRPVAAQSIHQKFDRTQTCRPDQIFGAGRTISASIEPRHSEGRAAPSPAPPRRQARTRTAACRGILVGWDLKSGPERRRTWKLLARSEPAFDEKVFSSGVYATSTICEERV